MRRPSNALKLLLGLTLALAYFSLVSTVAPTLSALPDSSPLALPRTEKGEDGGEESGGEEGNEKFAQHQPLTSHLYNASTKMIPVRVNFIRLVSLVPNSRLSCAKSERDIGDSLVLAKRLWANRAGIELNFVVVNETTTSKQDREFESHLITFTNPRSNHNPFDVSRDLMRITEYNNMLNAWQRDCAINIICMGAFVGNNAVAVNNRIFIRTMQFLKQDLPMDRLRFARVVAHEIGHSFDLSHPERSQCDKSCSRNECSLMCQQKVISHGHDPRLAVALNRNEITTARKYAATAYDSLAVLAGTNTVGLHPFDQVSNTKTLGMRLVLFPDPIPQDLVANRLRFHVTKFKSMGVALVAVNPETNKVRTVAWNKLGTNDPRPTDSLLPMLDFGEVDYTWWGGKRHVGANLVPPAEFAKGELWGIMFSVPITTVAAVEGGYTLGVRSAGASEQVPEFTDALRGFSLTTPVNEDKQRGYTPKMALDVDYK
ncbi:hypothetical protein BASA81_000667 [Batrachochytrium salamandrivorans]|nr:hypothetical protein BASA81_000667 [Batrachochytrium salamandrivorans]